MSATPEPPAKEEKADNNKIEVRDIRLFRKASITVAFPNEAALTFRVKKTTPFGKIYDSIASQKGISVQSFSLSFDGIRVNRDETPKMLEMSDGDTIEVQLSQIGGDQ